MRLPLPEITAAGSPFAALMPWPGVPTYVHVVVGLAGPGVYLVNRCLISLLGWKALDRIEPAGVSELMMTITGLPGRHPWAPIGKSRAKNEPGVCESNQEVPPG